MGLCLMTGTVLQTFLKAPEAFTYVGWFMVLYIIASYIRLYPKKIFLSKRLCGGAFIVSLLLSWGSVTAGAWVYSRFGKEIYYYFVADSNKLLAVATAVSAFLFFRNLQMGYKIVEKLDFYGKEFLTRQTFEGEYANFEEPSDSNGFTMLNIDKIEAIISYIAEKVNNLFKVKLMKMLWYSDALAFIENGFSMTGMVYRHESMGALPIGHYSLMNLEKLNVQEEMSCNYDTMLHIYPTANMDYSVLDEKEKSILDKVIVKFIDFKAKDIVDYMHEERAYTETKPGEIIPFSLAKEIRAF